ncbi:hypothetical protein [Amycolatopsis jiangsuensis]|uniref:Uncharacterized protein n=1 Tax=Amycolatopsis jiangsuensis TaxID=1181879 RepID=A0A840J684_9PSEU|nr:hypothetical protein [Amycolatopsis jiangsuensis]MBB4689540.1 hypothetical protein [Amycolatopsis jiangsuensis]
MRELLAVDFLMAADDHLALELYTGFRAFRDREQFTFGPLLAGETHRCTDMVHYDLRDNLFARIRVGSYRTWGRGERLETKQFPGISGDERDA